MYRALGSSVPNRVAIRGIAPELRGFHAQHNASITARSSANRADDRCLRPPAVAAPSRVTARDLPRAGRGAGVPRFGFTTLTTIREGSGFKSGARNQHYLQLWRLPA